MPSLLELVSASVPLKRRGRDWWAPCPFHQPDKTGSFKVGPHRGKQRFHCFGCGAHGDAIDWLMRTRNLTYRETRAILGQPVKPDPTLIAARQAQQRRQRILARYRNRNPDCCCPDWLLAI